MKNIKIFRIKSIAVDLYYRVRTLPLLFTLWLSIIICKLRIGKDRRRMEKTRKRLDETWILSERFKDKKYEKQKKLLKEIERDLLEIEKNQKDSEEIILERQEIMHRWFDRVFDRHFGE